MLGHKKKLDIVELFAEREGFEPPVPLSTPVFKTGTFNRSVISPDTANLVIIYVITSVL